MGAPTKLRPGRAEDSRGDQLSQGGGGPYFCAIRKGSWRGSLKKEEGCVLGPQEEKAAEFSSWKPGSEVRSIKKSQTSPGF